MFSIGADPEIFVIKNGQAISAHGLIPGTKKEPFKLPNGAGQVDGMALEFNINPSPVSDFDSFNHNVVDTVRELKTLANQGEVKGITFAKRVSVMDFGEEYLAEQPEEAKELGCDPDYDAYTMKANPRPDGTRTFRTAAGHIHVGWGADIPVENEEHMEICASFVKMLDATVGMLMTYMDREPRRRELYGKAGAFRVKSYGVEYRTPSNAWIWNRDRRKLVHYAVNKAIQYKTAGYEVERISGGYDEEDIRDIINTGDWQRALPMLDRMFSSDYSVLTPWKNLRKEMETVDIKEAA